MRARAALAVVVLAACGHEKLMVPPVTAPRPEREKAYAQLRPKHVEQYRIISDPPTPGAWNRSLVLGNGKAITEPVDLLQAVLPDSQTAKAVEEYQRKNKAWHILTPIAGYGFGVGATLATVGLVSGIGGFGSRDLQFYMLLTGGIMTIAAPIIALVIGWALTPDTERERQTAWASYDHDLKARLDLLPPPPAPVPEANPPEPQPEPEPAPAPAHE